MLLLLGKFTSVPGPVLALSNFPESPWQPHRQVLCLLLHPMNSSYEMSTRGSVKERICSLSSGIFHPEGKKKGVSPCVPLGIWCSGRLPRAGRHLLNLENAEWPDPDHILWRAQSRDSSQSRERLVGHQAWQHSSGIPVSSWKSGLFPSLQG